MSYPYKEVLQVLKSRARLSADAFAKAQETASGSGMSDQDEALVESLVAQRFTTWNQITKLLADEFGMETVDLAEVRPSDEALAKVDRNMAERYEVFPISLDGKNMELAVLDPLDMDTVDNLSHMLNVSIEPRLTNPSDWNLAVSKHYGGATGTGDAELDKEFASMAGPADTGIAIEGGDGAASEAEAPIIRYVHALIMEAIKRRASDIHLEPLEKRFRVRYRVDGVLMEVENPPKRLQPAIINRVKIMSRISIAEKRLPQDGRIQVKHGKRDLDLRVSCLPTAFGESIVMRILDKEGLRLGLPQLGFFSDDQAIIEKVIGMPDGIFLVTGPTGSGKSTTLYSCLNKINKSDRKIITVEDPVEYQMAGINQVQVMKEVGMDFASALRSMLRQAPNIIMVGEIRDRETAEIAINASLTGHMVFSTLHTNDAPSAVSRLVDIGVKPFLVSAALRAAMAQRLIRVVCNDCKQPYEPTTAELHSIGITEQQISGANFQKGKGCPRCNGRGCRGRNGIFEIFLINEEIQQMIYENVTLVELRRKAREHGMRTMREDGIRKILAGITTIDEVVNATVIAAE